MNLHVSTRPRPTTVQARFPCWRVIRRCARSRLFWVIRMCGIGFNHGSEHRPVDGRFHIGKDEPIHATKYNGTLPPAGLPGDVPPGHMENAFTAHGECRHSMGTVPGTAGQAGPDVTFPAGL